MRERGGQEERLPKVFGLSKLKEELPFTKKGRPWSSRLGIGVLWGQQMELEFSFGFKRGPSRGK